MKNAIKQRTSQWWHPKAGIILSAVYLSVLINKVSFADLLAYFIPAVTTILGIGVFGYFINDFFDRKSDEKANKQNMLHGKSNLVLMFFFLAALIIAFLPWLVLPYDLFGMSILACEFLLLVIYAAPPFRLKEKGFLALLADALYAYAIPFVLAFHTFSLLDNEFAFQWTLYVWISVWLLLAGVYNLAIHQIDDYDNDKKSHIKTWVVSIGKEKVHKWSLCYIWTFKMLAFLVFSMIVCSYNIWMGIILCFVFLVKLVSSFKKGVAAHYANRNLEYLQQINFHYHLWLPYLLLGILSLQDYRFVFILLAHYLLFGYGVVISIFKRYMMPLGSYMVNYTIYYLFLLFGVNLKKENKSALQYLKEKWVML